jgi:hypothetical protein
VEVAFKGFWEDRAILWSTLAIRDKWLRVFVKREVKVGEGFCFQSKKRW